jgi:hypothetical protein
MCVPNLGSRAIKCAMLVIENLDGNNEIKRVKGSKQLRSFSASVLWLIRLFRLFRSATTSYHLP